MVSAPKQTIIRARKLRQSMTLPEGLLWQILRQRPGGFKFRKQHPIGPYVLDFFCFEHRLAIEVDGSVHNMGDQPTRDEQRDEWLKRRGIRVVRFAAHEVLASPESVAASILALCAQHPA